MKKISLTLLTLVLFLAPAKADEGMWLLPFIEKLNIGDMKAKGFKLEAEDIYSLNNECLMDAVMIFGGGCTGELISDKGLILTNHHCGYSYIQQHSSVDHDYLLDGFWAMSFEEELPNPGLSVKFVKKITDVSDKILPHLTASMSEKQRNEEIATLIKNLEKQNKPKETGRFVTVSSLFGGNQYLMFEMEQFDDIRMVGAPPSSIGKFGGDTDNWMWPRHTGDFSLFRVYTDKNGKPAAYSKDNIPMKPAKHLPISIKGVKKGDFSMVLGFPGSTSRYMTAAEVEETLNQRNPIRIKVRGIRLDILMNDMMADQKTKIQYASKYARSSNYWKNAIGMNKGIENLDVVGQKTEIEERFTEWVEADEERKAEYGEALDLIKKAVNGRMPYNHVNYYIQEALTNGMELAAFAYNFNALAKELNKKEQGAKNNVDKVLKGLDATTTAFYKDYNAATDRKVAKAMIKVFIEDVVAVQRPTIFSVIENTGVDKSVDYMYDNSIFADQAKLEKFLENPSSEGIVNDPAFAFIKSINETRVKVSEAAKNYNEMYEKGHRLFIKGYTEMDKDVKKFASDANKTIRMTYGNIMPYLKYNYTTLLSEVLAKEDPNNAYEFTVHPKLKELYKNKDFGQYGKKDVVVAFISNNDITGGNSGSPVINGKGELIGTAFDGNWEAMSGDIAFEPELQRCIAVDIRYTLFIIDKFAGCTRLIDEMTIVK